MYNHYLIKPGRSATFPMTVASCSKAGGVAVRWLSAGFASGRTTVSGARRRSPCFEQARTSEPSVARALGAQKQ